MHFEIVYDRISETTAPIRRPIPIPREEYAMLTVEPIRRRYGETICRTCINRQYRASLQPKDCLYGYTYTCPRCGRIQHLVNGFTLSGKLKMLFRR